MLAQVAELDRDAPDYDRALVDLAAFLQRIAIVQIVPDAAHEDEEFDAEALTRLSRAMAAEDVQLYYQIALAGRRDLSLAPDPRLGFEMTLLRMLAFRPDAAAEPSRGRPGRRSARLRLAMRRAAVPPGAPAAATAAIARERSQADGCAPPLRRSPAPRSSMPPRGRASSRRELERHGAAVRAQLRPGLLRARRAHVAAR